jgi:2-hydroxy-6-oxonona-2,4-dienedioate hydrolase
MQECGHWPQFENAPLFNRLTLDFLAGRDIEAAAAE